MRMEERQNKTKQTKDQGLGPGSHQHLVVEEIGGPAKEMKRNGR